MDKQELLIATNIAILRRQLPPIGVKKQIREGIRLARVILTEQAVDEAASGNPVFESPIVEINTITATTAYATIVEKTIERGWTGKISRMEMACRTNSDYDIVTWKLTINSNVVFENKLPHALTLDLVQINIAGGKLIKIEAKTSTGTADIWADITGKEIF